MKILITGGAGYIGTHTVLQLLREKHEVFVYDSFRNSSPEGLKRVKKLANTDFEIRKGEMCSAMQLNRAFSSFRPDAVMHLAGLKSVGESEQNPLLYYQQNVSGSITLLDVMRKYDCRQIVFSSSATVYGEAKYLPYDEKHPLKPINPYGRTKYFIEEIIRDWTESWSGASAVLLRYFNPVGADASGLIGEDPKNAPSNLTPLISQIAVGRRKNLQIFGGDYETRDGTGERDYIHVEDLARAHLAAVEFSKTATGCEAINVGTGYGVTVLEMIKVFEKVSGRKVPYNIESRRIGDVARSFAAVGKAERILGWKPNFSIDDMCWSIWNWQSMNPNGFKKIKI